MLQSSMEEVEHEQEEEEEAGAGLMKVNEEKERDDDVLGRRWMRGQERLERLLHLQCCDGCVSRGRHRLLLYCEGRRGSG